MQLTSRLFCLLFVACSGVFIWLAGNTLSVGHHSLCFWFVEEGWCGGCFGVVAVSAHCCLFALPWPRRRCALPMPCGWLQLHQTLTTLRLGVSRRPSAVINLRCNMKPPDASLCCLASCARGICIAILESLNGWDVSFVTYMSSMFRCKSFQSAIGWNVSSVTNMSSMFSMPWLSTAHRQLASPLHKTTHLTSALK